MTQMTDDEIIDEILRLQNSKAWPLYPMLPVVNREQKTEGIGGLPLLRLVFANKPTVYVGLIVGKATAEDLKKAPKEEFDSWKAFIDAGWLGD